MRVRTVFFDADDVTEDAVRECLNAADGRNVIIRMPDRRTDLHESLCRAVDGDARLKNNDFDDGAFPYFSRRAPERLAGEDLFSYLYLDTINGLRYRPRCGRRAPEMPLHVHPEDAPYGCFVLVSNKKKTPAALLERYLAREQTLCNVLQSGRPSGSFTTDPWADRRPGFVPSSQWTDSIIRGKLLLDVLNAMIRQEVRGPLPHPDDILLEPFDEAQGIFCWPDPHLDLLHVEEPRRFLALEAADLGVHFPKSPVPQEWARDLLLV